MSEDNQRGQDVAVFQPARLPWHPAIESRFEGLGVNKASWNVLVGAIYPAAKSVDSVVMALSYCTARKLDPFKKPVHIVPMWDSQRGQMVETVWPGISEIRTTAFRTGQYAGCDAIEEGPQVTKTFTGRVGRRGHEQEVTVELTFPEWGRMTVYRNLEGVKCKFVGPKVYWLETYARQGKTDVPNEMWQKRKEGQFEKCVEAAALRKAFPEEIGNDYSAEEMSGQVITAPIESVPIPAQPGAPAIEAPPAPPPDEEAPAPSAKAPDKPTPAPVEDAEFTEAKSDSEQDEAFDPEAWLDEARDLFATCKATSDVDQAHETFGCTAESHLSMTERQRYQDIHEAALLRVKPVAHKRRFFIHPESDSYFTTDDGTDAGHGNLEIAEVREPEYLEFKAKVDTAQRVDDGPGAPPAEDDDEGGFGQPDVSALSPADEHSAWLLKEIGKPGITQEAIAEIWEQSKPTRKEMIAAGDMTKGERDAMHARLRVVYDGLGAAAGAKGVEATVDTSSPQGGGGTGDVAAQAKAMTERLAAALEAAEDVSAVNDIGTETFPERTALLKSGADPVLDDLWRTMVLKRRNTLNGI